MGKFARWWAKLMMMSAKNFTLMWSAMMCELTDHKTCYHLKDRLTKNFDFSDQNVSNKFALIWNQNFLYRQIATISFFPFNKTPRPQIHQKKDKIASKDCINSGRCEKVVKMLECFSPWGGTRPSFYFRFYAISFSFAVILVRCQRGRVTVV